MLLLAPRLFSALGIRVSQASRLLTAPICWWRGWVRPRTTRRRPTARLARMRRPALELLDERIMLGDGTLAGVLITGSLLPNHSPLEQVEGASGATALIHTLPVETPSLDYRLPRDHGSSAADSDSPARFPDLSTILATPPQNKVAQEVTHSQDSNPSDMLSVAATNSPKASDEFASGPGEFDRPSTPSTSAKNRPPLPSDVHQYAGANAGAGAGGGPGGASTNNGGGGGSSGGGGGAGPGAAGFGPAELAAMTSGSMKASAAGSLATPLSQGLATPMAGTAMPTTNNTGQANGLPASPAVRAPASQFTGTNASTITVSSSPNPSVYGQPVTLTATVSGSGGTPTGTVTFLDGGTALGSATLQGGIATLTTTALAVNAVHGIHATYNGDTTFAASTSAIQHQTVNKASTSTSADTSVVTPAPGQLVTLLATVAPVAPGAGTPTGTVTFSLDGTTQSAVTLQNGVARLNLPNGLALGTHTIQAAYSGNPNFTVFYFP